MSWEVDETGEIRPSSSCETVKEGSDHRTLRFVVPTWKRILPDWDPGEGGLGETPAHAEFCEQRFQRLRYLFREARLPLNGDHANRMSGKVFTLTERTFLKFLRPSPEGQVPTDSFMCPSQ